MSTNIPDAEVQTLIDLAVGAFNSQYQLNVDSTVNTPLFITPRTDTLIGFEVDLPQTQNVLRLRIYARRFTSFTDIKPFALEDIQHDNATKMDIVVYVSISDLPESQFPTLSACTDPVILATATFANGITTESNVFITTELGVPLALESST